LELSGVELTRIVAELNEALSGYYVSNISSIDDTTWLIRLHHPSSPEKRLVISTTKGVWLTAYELPTRTPDTFVSHLRDLLVRGRFIAAEQPDVERIIKIKFLVDENERDLVAEFFGGGNLLVVDEEGRILTLLKKIEVRHRRLAQGLTYTPPPPRGKSPFADQDTLLEGLDASGLEISRYLGRELALSRKYVEEVLFRAGVEPRARSLTQEQKAKIISVISELKELILRRGKPTILLKDGRAVDASPFELTTYREGECRYTNSFMEAVDEVQTPALLEELKKREEEPLQKKIEELNRALEAQAKRRLELKEQAAKLRELATHLRRLGAEGAAEDLTTLLTTLNLEYKESRGEYLEIKGFTEPIQLPLKASPISAASALFDAAKRVEAKVRAIEEAERNLSERKAQILAEAARESELKPLKRVRVKKWFERYRWFYTSKGLLAVGGRDASSNTAILRRHTQENDLVFHADLHGSPFFVLKGGAEADEDSIKECCKAVAAYSSAWKAEISAVDVYWVKPPQVKFTGPSGTYLPKGAFLIEGEKNWVKNVKVEVSVGVSTLDDDLVVIGGPPEALKVHSLAYAVLSPEKGKVSDVAKRVKVELMKIAGRELSARIKEIPLDDFIRALPSGGGRIVSTQLGEQKQNRV
jgi:predicted ribosome quality control (RQC) complex YloA/Tae2 family protein